VPPAGAIAGLAALAAGAAGPSGASGASGAAGAGAALAAGAPDRPVAGWTAACDGGYLMRYAGIPSVVLGPGSVVDQAHRPDESVPVDDVEVAARAYALYAARVAGHVTP
jgi:acetylornithine deacetylase/succinyl-diaminopimelate desuccinylase-like protein